MKIVVGFLKRTEVKLALLLLFLVALLVASFGDIFVILVDAVNWFRK